MKAFNAGEASVFLISLKAGGTGLNLTAADIVIHYASWWNHAAQDQATDRAHRIGLQAHVQVYKLIAKDTIEDKILELQEKKAALMDAISVAEEGGIPKMTSDELLSLLEIVFIRETQWMLMMNEDWGKQFPELLALSTV